ncbi:MAG: hypothetical protein ACRDI2_22715, partial [Chloroflexota bacterium]
GMALRFGDRYRQRLSSPAVPPAGVALEWVGDVGDEEAVRGDFRLVEFPDAGGPLLRYGTAGAGEVPRAAPAPVQAHVLLRHQGIAAGYRVQVRSGTSTVLGTMLGGAYVTSRYHALDAAERLALRRFAIRLFEDVAPRQIVPDDALEVETVARLSPDGGCLLFVVNRLSGQSGALRFPSPELLNLSQAPSAEVLYSASGSPATAVSDGLRLDLAAGDVLIVRMW